MCSQTMMSSVETLQGFKVTKPFFPRWLSGALHQGFGGELQPGTPGMVIISEGRKHITKQTAADKH